MMEPENTASARFARGGQRFACQRGLIHLHRVAVQQARVRRHNVALAHADDIARHQLARRWVDPLPVTFYRALIASLALRASMALPAVCSSQNPTTALATSKRRR